jgi:ABC-type antimicrobial peptide transport system permease subunit
MFFIHVLHSCSSFIVSTYCPEKAMLKNYLIIALRNLRRNASYSFITIAGLALGMACCILLALQVRQEFSFDSFHAKRDRLFRIYQTTQTAKAEESMSQQPLPLAPTLKSEMPSIEFVTRFCGTEPATIKHNGAVFRESPVFVDADFFRMFSFAFLQGSPDAAFGDIRSVVLTKEVADKMFGENANALGKPITVQLQGEHRPFIVSGVIANPPANSSLEVSILLRFEQYGGYERDKNAWQNISTDTYICLREQASVQALERDLQPFVNKHFAQNIQDQKEMGIKPNARGNYHELHAQPLDDWHFDTALDKSGAAKAAVYGLMAIAAMILLIAAINFINLSVARSLTRSREVGIRKTVGARRSQLVVQFLGEALVVVVCAMAVSVMLAELMLPLFNSIMRTKLSLVLAGGLLPNAGFWGASLLVLLVVGLLAGAYPALYVSGLAAVATIKGRLQGITPSRLRSVLVVVQFALAVGLIACTLIIRQQTEFMLGKSLGFNRDHVVMIPTGDGANGKATLQKLRALLAGNSSIVAMSSATKPIGRGLDGSNTRSHITRTFNGGQISVDVLSIDVDYLETIEVPMLAGRTFSRAHIVTDTLESVIVNELAARQIWNLLPASDRAKRSAGGVFTPQAMIGLSVPSGEEGVPPMNIIGVTADYHVESLRRTIQPAIHVMWSGYPASYVFVRMRPDNAPATMSALEAAWKRASPDVPWQGSFLDENIARLYRTYTRQTQLTLTAASLAVMLSCVGLFALAAMMMAARTKEIGIRKVLGASVASIIGLLTKDFLKLVLVAIVLATPVVWWLMRGWLDDFAYRVELQWWVFALAGVLAVAIAFVTIAGQSWRAARANPVNALRSE